MMYMYQHKQITIVSIFLLLTTTTAFLVGPGSSGEFAPTATKQSSSDLQMFSQKQRLLGLASLLFKKRSPRSSKLGVGAVYDESPVTEGSILWMARATHCANSETCDLEEAQTCLHNLVDVRLEELDIGKAWAVSKVATSLQRKIEEENLETEHEPQTVTGSFQATMAVMNLVAGVYVACAMLHDFSGASSLPIDSPVLSCFDAYTMF